MIVTAGEYTVTGAPINVVYGGLQIHGDPAGPMPRVDAELGGLPAINMNAEGSSLSYIEVVNRETEGIGVRCGSTSRVERVRATGIGEGAAGLVQFQECLVRDSLLRGEGTNSLGMESLAVNQGEPPSTVSNVTAIAIGANSAGIQSRYNDSRRRLAHPQPDQLDRARAPPTFAPKTATGRGESLSRTRTST